MTLSIFLKGWWTSQQVEEVKSLLSDSFDGKNWASSPALQRRGTLIWDFPGITDESVARTIQGLKKINLDSRQIIFLCLGMDYVSPFNGKELAVEEFYIYSHKPSSPEHFFEFGGEAIENPDYRSEDICSLTFTLDDKK